MKNVHVIFGQIGRLLGKKSSAVLLESVEIRVALMEVGRFFCLIVVAFFRVKISPIKNQQIAVSGRQ